MSDIDRRSRYILPGQRPTQAVVAAPLASAASVEFVDLRAMQAELELLRARDLAWRGLAHAHNLPAPGPAVSGIRSGADRQ